MEAMVADCGKMWLNGCMEVRIDEKLQGLTIKQIALKHFSLSTRMLNRLKFSNGLLVNNVPQTVNFICKFGDVLEIHIDDEADSTAIVPTEGELEILFEDEWLMAVNKPPLIPVHPGRGNHTGSLCNFVKFHLQKKGVQSNPRIVTRLDRNTSGIVVIALNQLSASKLSAQLISGTVEKEYVCIARNTPNPLAGKIALPLCRKAESIINREVNENGKPSLTNYETLKVFGSYSLIAVSPVTGRTHQIRVHMAHIGCPLLGDGIYGEDSQIIGRQALHMQKIGLNHPFSGKRLTFSVSLPLDMQKALETICSTQLP